MFILLLTFLAHPAVPNTAYTLGKHELDTQVRRVAVCGALNPVMSHPAKTAHMSFTIIIRYFDVSC